MRTTGSKRIGGYNAILADNSSRDLGRAVPTAVYSMKKCCILSRMTRARTVTLGRHIISA